MSLRVSSSSAATVNVLRNASLLLFIAEYLDLPSIVHLSAVESMNHLPRTIAYFRLLSLLRKFVGNVSAFVEMMSQTKCIVGGLGLVRYFNGPTSGQDENPRLEVFIPKSQCETVRLHLAKDGYPMQEGELASSPVRSALKIICLRRERKDSVRDDLIDSIPVSRMVTTPVIFSECKTKQLPGINLIVSSSESPYDPLLDYHCTAGVAYCTSNAYVCLYPDALSQGFSVYQNPYSDFFRTALSKLPNLKAYASMSHLYGLRACGSLCRNLQRHYRDSHSFCIEFRPHKPSGDEALVSTTSATFQSSGCWNSKCNTNDASILIPILESKVLSNSNFSVLSLICAQLQMCINAHTDLVHIIEVLKEQRAILSNRAIFFAELTQDFILQQANTVERSLSLESRPSESSSFNGDVKLAQCAARLCILVAKHLPKLLTWRRSYSGPKTRGSVGDSVNIRKTRLRRSLINLRNDVENDPYGTTLRFPCTALDLASQLVEDYIIIFFNVLEIQGSINPDLQIIKYQASRVVDLADENRFKAAIINSFTKRTPATRLYSLDISLKNLECTLRAT